MNTNKTRFGFYAALLLVSASIALAQPANDNFDNRTVLSGSQITFGGSLAGATLEPAESTNFYPKPYGSTGSVWWTWTASETGPVVISMPNPHPTYNGVNVFTGADFNTLTRLGWGTSFNRPLPRYFRFDASAGTTYQIQVVGYDTQP